MQKAPPLRRTGGIVQISAERHGLSTLCGILDSRNDKEDKLMDQCEEMRAQVERLCDGHQAASGTTQIQAISGSQMKSIRR